MVRKLRRNKTRNLRRISSTLAVCAALLPFAPTFAHAQTATKGTPAQRDSRMAWWRDARFGMFIHWGLYAGAAGAWDGKPTGGAGDLPGRLHRHLANLPHRDLRRHRHPRPRCP